MVKKHVKNDVLSGYNTITMGFYYILTSLTIVSLVLTSIPSDGTIVQFYL